MTIDKEQLISLLIDKTGLEPEEVEDQLSELINRIQQAAEKGKTFEIEGFGVFSMDEGNLQFEPSDTLETEINNKYAGMKPIELIGAFKEPGGDEVPEMPEEETPDEITEDSNKWTFDRSAAEEESAEEPVAQEGEEEADDVETEESVDQSEEEPVGSEEDAQSVYEKIFGTEEEQRQREFAARQEAEQQHQDTVDDEPETDPLGRLLVAAVVVIALGVGGWLVYDAGMLGGSSSSQQMSEQSSQQERVPAQQTGDTRQETVQDAPPQKTEADKTSEPEQHKQVVKQEGSRTTEAEQQNRFGLEGEYNQSIGGYTIVVHSLRSMRVAENSKQDLQEAGFRALINKAEVGGTTYYRVGIGQFQTVDDAQQAARQLPERYRETNFIKRIR